MKKLFALVAALMIATSAAAQDYLDTQFGPYGWNVHLLRANVANNVLTVAFMIESTSSSAEFMDSMDVSEVAYTTSDKRFPVLVDANGQHLASTNKL